jgi:hypothetical protein
MDLAAPHRLHPRARHRFEGRLPLRREASASKGGHRPRSLPSKKTPLFFEGRLPSRVLPSKNRPPFVPVDVTTRIRSTEARQGPNGNLQGASGIVTTGSRTGVFRHRFTGIWTDTWRRCNRYNRFAKGFCVISFQGLFRSASDQGLAAATGPGLSRCAHRPELDLNRSSGQPAPPRDRSGSALRAQVLPENRRF